MYFYGLLFSDRAVTRIINIYLFTVHLRCLCWSGRYLCHTFQPLSPVHILFLKMQIPYFWNYMFFSSLHASCLVCVCLRSITCSVQHKISLSQIFLCTLLVIVSYLQMNINAHIAVSGVLWIRFPTLNVLISWYFPLFIQWRVLSGLIA